jgi:hypothetical protein
MFIEKFHNATTGGTRRLEVNKPIWALLLVRSAAPSFVQSLMTAPERVTVELNSKSGRQISLAHRLEMGVMAHYGQYGEGIITEDYFPMGVPGVIGGEGDPSYPIRMKARIILPLTPGRSIPLQAEETLAVQLDGLLTNSTYEVYGLEFPETGTNMLEYSVLTMAQGVRSRTFSVDNAEALILRNGSYLDRVSVTFKNGFVANYSLAEIIALNSENNDLEGVVRAQSGLELEPQVNGTLVPFTNYFVTTAASKLVTLIVRDAVSVEVLTDGTEQSFYQVSMMSRLAA